MGTRLASPRLRLGSARLINKVDRELIVRHLGLPASLSLYGPMGQLRGFPLVGCLHGIMRRGMAESKTRSCRGRTEDDSLR